ncbi:Cof-type HAD-IIB family hydrolase [Chloroflexota bacterium]
MPLTLVKEGAKEIGLLMDYKLLLIDIDGTLLDKNGVISAEDRNALAEVSNLGVQVSLSTGRVAKACSSIINQLSLDSYHIFFDGALVSDPNQGKEIYVRPIDKMVVKQAVEFAHLNGINLEFYSADHYFVEQETWASDIRRDFYRTPPNVVDITKLWQEERIIKGVLTLLSPEEKARAELLYLQFKDTISFSLTKTPAYPEVDFINVLAPDVSKGKASGALASFLGIPLAEVMAMGDGPNDISLLSSVGLGIAMGDAPDELKAIADYVTLDVDHNGLAEAIKKFLL